MALFYLFLLTLPFQFALNPFTNVDLPFGRVLVLLFFAVVLFSALKERSLKISTTPLSLILFAFVCWAGLSLAWADSFTLGARKLLFLVNFIPLFWAIPLLQKRDTSRVEVLILYSGFIVAFFGIAQFFAQFIVGTENVVELWKGFAPFLYGKAFGQEILQHSSWLVELPGRSLFRAIGFFPDPHILGFYLAFVTPLAFLSKRRLFNFLGVVFVTTLLLTFSRAAYIGAFVALACYLVMKLNEKLKTKKEKRQLKIKNHFKLLLVIFTFSFFLFTLLLTPIGSRLYSSFNLEEGSNTERLANWTQATGIIAKHPFLGVGIGNYALTLDPFIQPRTPIYAHNLYLDLWAELGLAGLTLFLLVALCALKNARKNYQPAFYTFIWFFVQSFFDMPLFSVHILPLLMIFFVLADTPAQIIKHHQTLNTKS